MLLAEKIHIVPNNDAREKRTEREIDSGRLLCTLFDSKSPYLAVSFVHDVEDTKAG